MASVLPSVIDESLFQCRLCCRSAADPRLLRCLHVFCRTCLLRHVARLRAAAVAEHPNTQDEPEDQVSLEPVDKLSSSTGDRGVEDGLPASDEGRPPVAVSGPALPAKTPSVAEDDELAYEIPNDYEDVEDDQVYANDVLVTASGSHVVANKLGYALMVSKPLTSDTSSSPQVSKLLCTRLGLRNTIVIIVIVFGVNITSVTVN